MCNCYPSFQICVVGWHCLSVRSEALVTLIETAGTYKLRIFNMNTCQGKKKLDSFNNGK